MTYNPEGIYTELVWDSDTTGAFDNIQTIYNKCRSGYMQSHGRVLKNVKERVEFIVIRVDNHCDKQDHLRMMYILFCH